MDRVARRFHDRHEQRYGHAYPEEPVELVTVRLRARGLVDEPDLRAESVDGTVADAVTETREVVYDGRARETRVYERDTLPTDAEFDGPAVVEGRESTVVVHPDQRVRVDEYRNLHVEVES
jgi:N-methylhydantoinase A